MGSIRGNYVWDNDDLRPGQRVEGGLSQNLYDTEGKLRAGARFIPAEEEDEPLVVTETVYVSTEERRRDDTGELARFVAELLRPYAEEAVRRGGAAMAAWWRETGSPAMKARKQRRLRTSAATVSTDLMARAPRPRMSAAEAQARHLAALAAQVFSDEQMRLIEDADIVGDTDADPPTVAARLAALPAEQVTRLVQMLATNPHLLEDEGLADLACYVSYFQDRQPELS